MTNPRKPWHEKILKVGHWLWIAVVLIWKTGSEWFCWVIIAVPFVYLEFLSLTKGITITGMQLALAILAVLPWMLRLLARYLSEFNIGPSGISGKIRETVANRAEIDTPTPSSAAGTTQQREVAVPPTNPFLTLLPQTKKVLRTLWKFQVEHFGPDDVRRWGFSVGTNAPDYHEFSLGALELIKNHFVAVNPKGFVFLTNEGIQFCKDHNTDVIAYSDFYQKFSS